MMTHIVKITNGFFLNFDMISYIRRGPFYKDGQRIEEGVTLYFNNGRVARITEPDLCDGIMAACAQTARPEIVPLSV